MPRELIIALPCNVEDLQKALSNFAPTDTVNTNYLEGGDALWATTIDDSLFEESETLI